MDAVSRKLLFRIGEVGFSLDLEELIEICEQVADQIDFSTADPASGIVGSLLSRSRRIPIFGLAQRLELESQVFGSALILGGADGHWALLVSDILGFVSDDELVEQDLPRLLQRDGWHCFNRLCLYEGQPFLKLRPAACTAGGLR